MAGTNHPLAALTAEDRGPISIIVSIILPIISLPIVAIRIYRRRSKSGRFELDDVPFGTGLVSPHCISAHVNSTNVLHVFAIGTSVLSYHCVRAGLGRHQETLDEKRLMDFSKLFWASQITCVIALALAQLTIVLIFRQTTRLTSEQRGHQPLWWLVIAVVGFTLVSLFLIAFQCRSPRPWALGPGQCWTHGGVYYAATVFNMLTDGLLAFWMMPTFSRLQMEESKKRDLNWMFASRLLVSLVDIVRIRVIYLALQSEDQTRSRLHWAILNQIVIYLSIWHATLPRIHIFFADLQTGNMSVSVVGTQSNSSACRVGDSPILRRTGQQSTTCQSNRRSLRNPKTPITNLAAGSRSATSLTEGLLDPQGPGIELAPIEHARSRTRNSNVVNDPTSPSSLSGSYIRLGAISVRTKISVAHTDV